MRGVAQTRKVSERAVVTLITVLATFVALLVLASPAKAETITVNNTLDPGDGICSQPRGCTLREAINRANTNNQRDVIDFAVPGDVESWLITLDRGKLTVANDVAGADLSITGPGDLNDATPPRVTVSGNNASRVFEIAEGAEATINELTVTKGSKNGILNYGKLTVNSSKITDNNDSGIASRGTLAVNYSTISDNQGFDGSGGGIDSDTDIVSSANPNPAQRTTIRNSRITGNTAQFGGGGVLNYAGLTIIEDSVITKNTEDGWGGGGIASRGSSEVRTDVQASIISGNAQTDVDSIQGSTNSFNSLGSNKIGTGNAVKAFDQPGDQVGPPKIKRLSPKPGAKIKDRTPKIKATVKSQLTDLSGRNIELYVDGKKKTNFSYREAKDRLIYKSKRLSYKRHKVKIVAKDGWGNTTTRSWRFTVKKR